MCTAWTNPTTHPESSALRLKDQQRVPCHSSRRGSPMHASLTVGLHLTRRPCRQRVGDSTWGDSGSASIGCTRLRKSEFTHTSSVQNHPQNHPYCPLPSTVMIVTHFRGEFLAQQAERSRSTRERLQRDSSTDRYLYSLQTRDQRTGIRSSAAFIAIADRFITNQVPLLYCH